MPGEHHCEVCMKLFRFDQLFQCAECNLLHCFNCGDRASLRCNNCKSTDSCMVPEDLAGLGTIALIKKLVGMRDNYKDTLKQIAQLKPTCPSDERRALEALYYAVELSHKFLEKL